MTLIGFEHMRVTRHTARDFNTAHNITLSKRSIIKIIIYSPNEI